MSQKKMNLKEFADLGYLQEVNRNFFHPLGLAMSIKKNDDGSYSFSGILDAREDPEGFIFGIKDMTPTEQMDMAEKTRYIYDQLRERMDARLKLFGNGTPVEMSEEMNRMIFDIPEDNEISE